MPNVVGYLAGRDTTGMDQTSSPQHRDSIPPDPPVSPRPNQLTPPRRHHRNRWLEIITVVMLGTAAVGTSWSGYQAAGWDRAAATQFARANALRIKSSREVTIASRQMLYDLQITNNWLNAYTQGTTQLASICENRFRPEFLPVFKAWLALNPLHNPKAPAGPLLMPHYTLQASQQANQLEREAGKAMTAGEVAEQRSEDYVLDTVFLATVLFLTAMARRYTLRPLRMVLLSRALSMLLLGLYQLLVSPVR
jgi:hypothetical protein